jgi:hypothetical protein
VRIEAFDEAPLQLRVSVERKYANVEYSVEILW